MTVRSLLSNDLIRAFSSWCLLAVRLAHPAVPERSYHPPPVIVDGEEAWEVEEVLDSRLYYNSGQYKVKWVSFD